MIRDGIDPRPPRGVGPGAWLVEEIVAATPLDHWATDPAAFLRTPVADDWGPVLRRGLTRAALARRDPEWARALLTDADDDLIALLAGPERAARAARDLRLLKHAPAPWPDELTDAVLVAMARARNELWRLSDLCRLAMPAMSPGAADRVAEVAARLEESPEAFRAARLVAQLGAVLEFRREMHEEFAP
jgi:hypothetical protein